ncbi:MAG: hypothetical protein JWO55_701 [Candidatus Saccharibacteria bacterium]|jgi:hypothetical protein|nr:hypothetical protein [Candidatus Saccharibacteria bacterium]
MAVKEVALRKRQQIAKANRMMFMWVAAISAVVGIAVVGSVFLYQQAKFNEKVLDVKSKTASTLRDSNKAIPDLENKIRQMNTSQALTDSMAPNQTQPIRVVLDALPADANSPALGASLKEKFLNDPALKIESLILDNIAGVESQEDTSVVDATAPVADESASNEVTFRFSVSTELANTAVLKDLLQKLERSIRAIDVTSLKIETQGDRLLLTVEGRAFYEPAKTVELKEETVKP